MCSREGVHRQRWRLGYGLFDVDSRHPMHMLMRFRLEAALASGQLPSEFRGAEEQGEGGGGGKPDGMEVG